MTIRAPGEFGIIELRRYATHPGKRDTLIGIFEREFIESQEESGMVVIGHYRDLDDADSFVWVRGFADMSERRSALERFYTSKRWIENRDAANAAMVDSDNVLLLRSARPNSGLDLRDLIRPKSIERSSATGPIVAVAILMLGGQADDALIAGFEEVMLPRLRTAAARIGYFVTEERPNDFPQLPVRAEFAFVAIGACPDNDAVDAWLREFDESRLPRSVRSAVKSREALRLEPARRSLYR